MIDIGGLRHAGRAGCIDEQATIIDGERHALLGREIVVGELHHIAVDARRRGGGIRLAMHEEHRRAIEQRGGALEERQQPRVDDERPRADRIDAIGERRPRQIGVEAP